MAISHVRTVAEDSAGYVNSVTLTMDTGSGDANGLLVIDVYSRDTDTVTGITVDGVAADYEGQSWNPGASGVRRYIFKNPPTGSNDIVLSASGFKLFTMTGSVYSGVDQVAPISETVEAASGFGAAPSVTMTATGFIVGALNYKPANTVTMASGTILSNTDHSDANLGQAVLSTVNASSISWSATTSDNYNALASTLSEAAVVAAGFYYVT